MRSKAQIKGHPLHPILICFPLAFFIGTWLFDLLSIFTMYDFAETAFYLNVLGIVFALIAAVPGIIDYIHVVPPESSAKKRGAKHGLLNITVVILFSIALYFRFQAENENDNLILIAAIETVATVLLFISGWLGGTLVYRNQIGVDIRYADAGKWKEEQSTEKNGLAEVHDLHSLKLNQMKLVHVAGKRIVVARTEEGLVAFDDRCTHRGGSLAGGALICGTVQCPWHGSQFSTENGSVKAGPADTPIGVYKIIESAGSHYIRLSTAQPGT